MTQIRFFFMGLFLLSNTAIAQNISQFQCGPNPNKYMICHKPPGNPTNEQTISVNVNAIPAHENHGDYVGYCPNITYEHVKSLCGICDADVDPSCQ